MPRRATEHADGAFMRKSRVAMPTRSSSLGNDLRGAARLAVDATAGLTDLVEAVHARIARLPGSTPTAEQAQGRTRGISGLVYKSIRGVTRLAGGGVDALLGVLASALVAGRESTESGSERQDERGAVVAALNGVLGDHLEATANPLALQMTLRCDGRALPLQADELAAALPNAAPRVLVLLHGLCMNDVQWRRNGHDHGAALARDAGYSAVYLRYNTGRHIGANGAELSALLERLLAAWPVPLERVVLLGHSMGGLVARSALAQGAAAGLRWPARVDDLVCLGTPHQGATLERAGHWVDRVLGATPYSAPFARLGRLRSAGITDLRHGNLMGPAVAASAALTRAAHPSLPPHMPLPDGVRCYAMAGSLGSREGDAKGRLLGDGLVTLDSALGRHADPDRTLHFPPERQWTGPGLSHLGLLSDADVYRQLRVWLG